MFRSRVRSKLAVVVTAPILVATIAVVGLPQVAVGVTAVPVVLSFTATRTKLPNTGGKIVLQATLKFAKSCEITVSPGLNGFPKSFSCTSDRTTESVTLRANKGENPIDYTFGMTVKNSAGSAQATNVAVTEGAAPPPLSFTAPAPGNPTTVVFGREGVFVADTPLVVTVTNNSSLTQVVSGVSIGTAGDPSDFIINRNNCTYITGHAKCSLAVQFQPTGAGSRTGVVNIVDSSWGTAGTTAVLKLAGTGVWATATVSNANITKNVLDFPSVSVLTKSPAQSVTVTNVGSVPLYISSIGITGSESTDFLAAPGTCLNQVTNGFPLVVSLGQSCTFTVAFEPSGTGARSSNVVVADNTLATETQLGLSGVGLSGS